MAKSEKTNEASYAASMERLNVILENIDRSDVPIDELAAEVMEAADLLKHCKKILTSTEAKVKNVLEDLEAEFEGTDEE